MVIKKSNSMKVNARLNIYIDIYVNTSRGTFSLPSDRFFSSLEKSDESRFSVNTTHRLHTIVIERFCPPFSVTERRSVPCPFIFDKTRMNEFYRSEKKLAKLLRNSYKTKDISQTIDVYLLRYHDLSIRRVKKRMVYF
jgi:hypothetical protein